MSYQVIKPLLSGNELMEQLPLSDQNRQKIAQDRQEICDILSGRDPRLLIIIGPCSAWPKPAVLEYASRLNALNNQVKHALKLVMRAYIQKPRTTRGWSGPLNQPDLLSTPDINAGALYSRDMMLRIIDMGLPIADEALFTHNAKGFLELLSWVAIGARSSEDQAHRIFASAIDCPVGLKNPTHGELAIGINSIIAAQHSHIAMLDGQEIETSGNPYAHLVLRGSNGKPNYDLKSVNVIAQYMQEHHIKNPSIMIDASHDNCLVAGKKDSRQQPNIIFEILDNIENNPALKTLIKGFMIESFLKEGHQKISTEKPDSIDLQGLSITDPCLGWEDTEKMLLTLSRKLST